MLRNKVWATYRSGQEITKTPSAAYVAVAQEVQRWCIEHDLKSVVPKCTEHRDGRFWPTEAGCTRLTAWLAERGIAATVSIGPDNRFAFEWSTGGSRE